MNKRNAKLFYVILVVVGAGLVLYEQSKTAVQDIYILVGGFIALMLGLYKTTRLWGNDNKPGIHENTIFSGDREDEH